MIDKEQLQLTRCASATSTGGVSTNLASQRKLKLSARTMGTPASATGPVNARPSITSTEQAGHCRPNGFSTVTH